jgi:hypothetical protein
MRPLARHGLSGLQPDGSLIKMDNIEDILNPGEEDSELQILQDAATKLKEKFSTVQIFATRYDEKTGNSYNFNAGRGDWYARFGHAKMWVKAEENNAKLCRKNAEDF